MHRRSHIVEEIMEKQKLVFDLILLPQEWRVLEALHQLGVKAATRAVHELLNLPEERMATTYQILKRLVQFKMITGETTFIDGDCGLERRVFWSVSQEGTQLFFSTP